MGFRIFSKFGLLQKFTLSIALIRVFKNVTLSIALFKSELDYVASWRLVAPQD